MTPSALQKRAAIHFWERGRAFYNLAIGLLGVAAYFARAAICAGVGDEAALDTADVAWLFALAAIGANLCYSFVYALEFFLGGEDSARFWPRRGRMLVLLLGILFGAFLASNGGATIAGIQYPDRSPQPVCASR